MDKHAIFPLDHLKKGLEELKVPYTESQLELCTQFFYEYTRSMGTLNISTIDNPKDFIEKHVLDSLTAYIWIKEYFTIADLGSGGGFPGIILSIFLPEKSFTLIDVVEKKVKYLKHIIELLKLTKTAAYNASIAKVPGSFELIVSRAVGSLSKILLYSKPYLAKDTKILAYKGKKETVDKEILDLKKNISPSCYPVTVPFLEAERHIVILDDLKL